MSEMEQFFGELSRLRAETYVSQAYAALIVLLTIIDDRWQSAGLRAHLERNPHAVLAYLRDHPGFGAVLRKVYEAYRESLLDNRLLDDPTALLDFSTLISFLAEDYPASLPSPEDSEARRTLDEIQPRVATELIHATLPQVLTLTQVVWRMVEFLRMRDPSSGRAILLEFPVGNSLPTKLLERVLRRDGIPCEVLRVALSRNEKKAHGLTRRELLEQKLSAVSLAPQDTVILIDEWLSGANFRNLTDILRKLPTVRAAAFLPVALLTDDSASDARYESHLSEHDRLIARLGKEGTSFRFVFPRLGSRFERDGYFFWSEHDRLAGYRKFQTLGAFLSSLEETIERLKNAGGLQSRYSSTPMNFSAFRNRRPR